MIDVMNNFVAAASRLREMLPELKPLVVLVDDKAFSRLCTARLSAHDALHQDGKPFSGLQICSIKIMPQSMWLATIDKRALLDAVDRRMR